MPDTQALTEAADHASDVVVTPEMIEAGREAFYGFHIGTYTELHEDEIRRGLEAAFIAMLDARSES